MLFLLCRTYSQRKTTTSCKCLGNIAVLVNTRNRVSLQKYCCSWGIEYMAEESLSSWPNPYWWWTSFAAWWLGDVPCWLQMVLPLGWRQAVVMGKGEPCLVASALPTRGIHWHGLSRWTLWGKATRGWPGQKEVCVPYKWRGEFSSISFPGSEDTVVSAHHLLVSNKTSA